MGIQANDKITKLITKKYGSFSKENMKRYFLEEFFVGSSARKIDEQDYEVILEQMEKLAEAQGLTLEEIDYLGFGQRYSCIGVGDAVIKIGNTTEEVYENPYRLSPVYKQDLKKYPRTEGKMDLGLYVSQRANTRNVSESMTQEMYNLVRDAGGLWLDIKAENLGTIDHKMDFSTIYPSQDGINEQFGQEFSDYQGNLFVIDYEDMLFLTPELKDKMIRYEAPNINSVPRELLKGDYTNDQIYYEAFIKNSNKLLKYEMAYQRGKGDLTAAGKCFYQSLRNEREIDQIRYAQEQRYINGRTLSEIGDKYSIKEIGIRLAQKTNPKALEKITELVSNCKKAMKERKNAGKSSELVLEEIVVGELAQEKSLEESNEPTKTIPTIDTKRDLSDPYTTR